PYRGSWLDIEFDAKDVVYARIDRRRKIPATSLLKALGLDAEEILETYYNIQEFSKVENGWKIPFDGEKLKGTKPVHDLIDADTGDVVHEGGARLTARGVKKIIDAGVTHLLATDEDLYGMYLGRDIVDITNGEIFAE